MDIWHRLFRHPGTAAGSPPSDAPASPAAPTETPAAADQQAIERYRYLLRTAPPETIEQAHAEAFAQLTPEQRRVVLKELGRTAPEPAQVVAGAAEPRTLARLATRAELQQPRTLERIFGGMPGSSGGAGIGMGRLLGGSFLGGLAGTVLGGAVAREVFGHGGGDQGFDRDHTPGNFGGAGDDDRGAEDFGGDFGGDA